MYQPNAICDLVWILIQINKPKKKKKDFKKLLLCLLAVIIVLYVYIKIFSSVRDNWRI